MKGGSIGIIIVWLCLVILIVSGVVLIVIVTLQPSVYVAKTSSANTIVTKPDTQPLNLSFPHCFEISADAKQMFAILKGTNMEKKYAKLLDVYSIALCQQLDSQRTCVSKQLESRIATLNSWDANIHNKNAVSIVNSITKNKGNMISQFLVQVCDICEKQIAVIKNDENIHRNVKTQIIGVNSQFYRNHFDVISRLCQLN